MHYLRDGGSKAHLKGGRVRKMHYLRSEGSKAHSKGSEGSKVHLKGSEGTKAHLKWGRVEKRITQKVMMKHRSDNVESNALWSICMYTYLRNIGSHFFMVSFFSKVGVLVVNFDGFFALAYSSYILWSWPLERASYHHTSLSSTLYLKGCQFCMTFFLGRES